MIIEIRDLPEGRRVQRISLDITFENGSNETIGVTEDTTFHEEIVVSSVKAETPTPKVNDASETEQNREHKEIPPEMLNQEF